MASERCWCGRPLHYSSYHEQEKVEAIVKRFGEFINVRKDGHTYRVQRHYIALHGIRGKDLSQLNFVEVEHAGN